MQKPNTYFTQMSDNPSHEQNKWVSWLEGAIAEDYIQYYDYNHFSNRQEIGSGGFGKVYRVNWKNTKDVELKSFFNFNKNTARKIVREVIITHGPFIDNADVTVKRSTRITI